MARIAAASADRRPYTVEYYDDKGERHVIRRTPPPRLHRLLPKDEVQITRKRSDHWDEGDEVTVTGTTARQPNTLRVEDESGRHTFLSHRDVKFISRDGQGPELFEQEADPIGSRYLLWP
jgi:hypothetical protein